MFAIASAPVAVSASGTRFYSLAAYDAHLAEARAEGARLEAARQARIAAIAAEAAAAPRFDSVEDLFAALTA